MVSTPYRALPGLRGHGTAGDDVSPAEEAPSAAAPLSELQRTPERIEVSDSSHLSHLITQPHSRSATPYEVLDLDRFGTKVPTENIRKHGHLSKKTSGHAGEWKQREVYLTADRLYFSRLKADKAVDFIQIDQIRTILTGASTNSPVVRAALNRINKGGKAEPATPGSTKRRGFRAISDSTAGESTLSFRQVGVLDFTANELQDQDLLCFFDIVMAPLGDHAGRILSFRASSPAESKDWVAAIWAVKGALEESGREKGLLRSMLGAVARVYESERFQMVSMCLITLAFIVNILEAELMPPVRALLHCTRARGEQQ